MVVVGSDHQERVEAEFDQDQKRERFNRDSLIVGVVGDITAAQLAPLLDTPSNNHRVANAAIKGIGDQLDARAAVDQAMGEAG